MFLGKTEEFCISLNVARYLFQQKAKLPLLYFAKESCVQTSGIFQGHLAPVVQGRMYASRGCYCGIRFATSLYSGSSLSCCYPQTGPTQRIQLSIRCSLVLWHCIWFWSLLCWKICTSFIQVEHLYVCNFANKNLIIVFCYQNCSDPLWEKIVLEIKKNFWNSMQNFRVH